MGGLLIKNSHRIRSFIQSCLTEPNLHLSPELQELASTLYAQNTVSYKAIISTWSSIAAGSRPSLSDLFSGSEFVFVSPKPREKSEELKARLKKLGEEAERKAYAELVKDIAPKNEVKEPFSAYKDQIGFGVHVVLIMFTGYLMGYAAFRALFNHSVVMNAAGGIIGLVFGMMVETLLFIIRTSSQEKKIASASRFKKNLGK